MKCGTPHIIALKGFSNSGKTTTLESIVKFLVQKKNRCAVVKYIHSEEFSIDQPGKDTWRMRAAGGEPVVSYSNDEIAFLTSKKLDVEQVVCILQFLQPELDYIFLEGFWQNLYPKILFLRSLSDLENIIQEFLLSPIGNEIFKSSFCFSGIYFITELNAEGKLRLKLKDLHHGQRINDALRMHLDSLPIINIKDDPEKFLDIYRDSQILKKNI